MQLTSLSLRRSQSPNNITGGSRVTTCGTTSRDRRSGGTVTGVSDAAIVLENNSPDFGDAAGGSR